MKFARLGETISEIPVVVTNDGTWDLTTIVTDIDGATLAAGTLDGVAGMLDRGELAKGVEYNCRFAAADARNRL